MTRWVQGDKIGIMFYYKMWPAVSRGDKIGSMFGQVDKNVTSYARGDKIGFMFDQIDQNVTSWV
jgi:hypothetical protein